MSSVGFRQIGKKSSLTGVVRSLAAEYQKFAAKQITIETTDFKTVARSTQDLLKFNELMSQSKVKPITTQFYSPYEPDFKHVVLMLNLDQMGRYAIDSSGFGNHGKYAGAGYSPQKIMDDGIDLGFGENSEYFHFDGMWTFVFVEDSPQLQARKMNNPVTFTFRLYLMPHSWEPSDPLDTSKPRYIFAKTDDDQQQDGYACAMTADGNIKFTFSRAGVRTTVETGPGVITSLNPGYDDAGYTTTGFDTEHLDMDMTEDEMDMAIATFQIAILCDIESGFDTNGFDNGFTTSDDLQIAVDNSFIVGSENPNITYYSNKTINHLDLFVGNEADLPDDIDDPNANEHLPNFNENWRLRIGAAYPFTGDQQGLYKWHGGIQAFRIYRDLLLMDNDLEFLFSNKLSIANYPFGNIALAGYTMILPTAQGCCGYSVTGFTSTGYDTGIQGKRAIAEITENIHVGH